MIAAVMLMSVALVVILCVVAYTLATYALLCVPKTLSELMT